MCSAVLLACLQSSAFATEASPKIIDDPAYARPQRMVEVEPGRRLNLYCVGEGSPTVVFESGLGDGMVVWGLVQREIGAHTRACSYDRAGLGFSDPARRESDSANIADDLHRLLGAASIAPPYILVGHSLGGMHVRMYANTYLPEIAGMVLVDSSEEKWLENVWLLDPRQQTREEAFGWDKQEFEDQRACVRAAEHGFTKGSEAFKNCVPEPEPLYSDAINAVRVRNGMSVAYQRAGGSEQENYQHASTEELLRTRRWYGDMPMIVLKTPPRERRPDEPQAHRDATNRLHMVLADQMAALSRRGVVRVVPDSTHSIQTSQPQAVIDAVLEVLKEARAPTE